MYSRRWLRVFLPLRLPDCRWVLFCICSPSYISHICFLAFAQFDIFDNPSAYSAFYLDISHFSQYLSESVQFYFCAFLISFAWSIRGSFFNFIPNTHFLGVYHETKHSFCKCEGALSRMGWQFQWWDSLFSIDEVKVFRQWSDHLIPHSMHLKTNIVENMDMRQSKKHMCGRSKGIKLNLRSKWDNCCCRERHHEDPPLQVG